MAAALRVVSWNIRAAIGPGPFPDRWWRRIDADRLRAIGAFVEGLEPDLVALQEVATVSRDGELLDNAGTLARQLGMELAFGAVRTFEMVEDGRVLGAGLFGNALLSRTPMRDVRTIALPTAPMDAFVEEPGYRHPLTGAPHPAAGLRYADAPPTIREPRCVVAARAEGLTFGTAHLSHLGSGERRMQAAAAGEAVGSTPPAVLVGDLNAAIEAPELAPLAGWSDGFREPPGDPARRSTEDGFRIDHVLGRGVEITSCRVAREAGDLSDHYPLLAEVRRPAHASPVPTG